MAVLNDPNVAANVAGVGPVAFVPLHVYPGPLPIAATGGGFRYSGQSGTMAVSLAANSEIFQFRYVTSAGRVAVLHRITLTAAPNVAASAAALQAFRLTLARAWTAAGTGGTRVTFSGNQGKSRTSFPNASEVNDIGIATTGALTAGTKTLDSTDISSYNFGIGTGAITTGVNLQWCPGWNFAERDNDAYPIVLANQEGFVIRNHSANAFPAGATWTFGVDVVWSEVPAF